MKVKNGQNAEVPQQRRDERGHCDRICGKWVETDKAVKLGFEGKTYYFCSEDCRWSFERDPLSYRRECERG